MFLNQKGNSIIGAVVAIGCVAVMISASTHFLLNSRKTTATMLQINVRDKIQTTLKTVIRLPTAIRVSQNKPGNEALQNCLLRLGVFDPAIKGDCKNNKPGEKVPFILYGPMVDSSGGLISLSGELAGKETNPVEYNSLGAAIVKGSGEPVAMVVKSWFRAQCPSKTFSDPAEDECDVPEAMEFSYEIEMRSVDKSKQTTLRTFTESVVFLVKEIAALDPVIKPMLLPLPVPAPAPAPAPAPVPGPGPASTSGTGGVVAGSGTIVVPPAPLVCIGETIQTGPNQCACPPGQVLTSARRGQCSRISR